MESKNYKSVNAELQDGLSAKELFANRDGLTYK